MGKPEKNAAKIAHSMLGNLVEPPSPQCLTIAYALSDFLKAYADDGGVSSGHGFGESCLDFRMDGKDIRVIVKSVPDLDQENNDE